jgi:Fur family ferric uptake transcriptional regulator
VNWPPGEIADRLMHVGADQLIEALRSEGLRITEARRVICGVIAQGHGEHLSAADVLDRVVTTTGASINASTVYRTIDVLEQLDLIQHVHLGHGPGVLHFADDSQHHHLVCGECGKVADLSLEDIQPLVEHVAAQHGFSAATVHFALEGVCDDCRRAAGNSSL